MKDKTNILTSALVLFTLALAGCATTPSPFIVKIVEQQRKVEAAYRAGRITDAQYIVAMNRLDNLATSYINRNR